MRPCIDARAARNRQRAVPAIVKIGRLDCNVAANQENCPEALPFRLAGRDGAGALAVVMPNLCLIGGIVYRIVEAENVAEGFFRRMPFLYSVGDGMFNHVDGQRPEAGGFYRAPARGSKPVLVAGGCVLSRMICFC